MKIKNYTKPPLPFQGNKRMFLKKFKETLKEDFKDYENSTFIDAFGGSGLLSHTIKQIYPNARVIFNDFDGYMDRIKAIPTTNQILKRLEFLRNCVIRKNIPRQDKNRALEIIGEYEKAGEVIDYITLSSWLLFSGKYVHDFDGLKKHQWYLKSGEAVKCANGYLDGVEIVKKDFKELLSEHDKAINPPVLILDPPYSQTDTSCYKIKWSLGEFLTLCSRVKEPYILFGSSKSDILPFIEFLVNECDHQQFKNYKLKESTLSLQYNVKKENMRDYMIYKVK